MGLVSLESSPVLSFRLGNSACTYTHVSGQQVRSHRHRTTSTDDLITCDIMMHSLKNSRAYSSLLNCSLGWWLDTIGHPGSKIVVTLSEAVGLICQGSKPLHAKHLGTDLAVHPPELLTGSRGTTRFYLNARFAVTLARLHCEGLTEADAPETKMLANGESLSWLVCGDDQYGQEERCSGRKRRLKQCQSEEEQLTQAHYTSAAALNSEDNQENRQAGQRNAR